MLPYPLFLETSYFIRRWEQLGLTERDMIPVEQAVVSTPGDVIVNTGGFRKLRVALPGQGKSGGIRVVYLPMPKHSAFLFAVAYAKTEKATLTAAEKTMLRTIATEYQRELDEFFNGERT